MYIFPRSYHYYFPVTVLVVILLQFTLSYHVSVAKNKDILIIFGTRSTKTI